MPSAYKYAIQGVLAARKRSRAEKILYRPIAALLEAACDFDAGIGQQLGTIAGTPDLTIVRPDGRTLYVEIKGARCNILSLPTPDLRRLGRYRGVLTPLLLTNGRRWVSVGSIPADDRTLIEDLGVPSQRRAFTTFIRNSVGLHVDRTSSTRAASRWDAGPMAWPADDPERSHRRAFLMKQLMRRGEPARRALAAVTRGYADLEHYETAYECVKDLDPCSRGEELAPWKLAHFPSERELGLRRRFAELANAAV